MTEVQAALGLSQLDRLDVFVSRRRILADAYDAALADLPLRLPGAIGRRQFFLAFVCDQAN